MNSIYNIAIMIIPVMIIIGAVRAIRDIHRDPHRWNPFIITKGARK